MWTRPNSLVVVVVVVVVAVVAVVLVGVIVIVIVIVIVTVVFVVADDLYSLPKTSKTLQFENIPSRA